MGMKHQLNHKSYWIKPLSISHCPIISSIFFSKCYQSIVNCLHIANFVTYTFNKQSLEYNKLHQVWWLVNKVWHNFMVQWNLEKFVTIDKMMVHCKDLYCIIWQYMPAKPKKWGIKL